jgi:hypothetical protein
MRQSREIIIAEKFSSSDKSDEQQANKPSNGSNFTKDGFSSERLKGKTDFGVEIAYQ